MQRHWVRYGPPTYIAVALYLGLTKPDAPAKPELVDPDDLANFLCNFPGASRCSPGSASMEPPACPTPPLR
jgi:hypothetical protein